VLPTIVGGAGFGGITMSLHMATDATPRQIATAPPIVPHRSPGETAVLKELLPLDDVRLHPTTR
jgi:hypothetical protein